MLSKLLKILSALVEIRYKDFWWWHWTLRTCSQSVLVLANKLCTFNYLTAKKDAWSKVQWCKMMPMPVIKPQTKCQEASLEYGTNGTMKASKAFWAQGFGQNNVSLPIIGVSANCISFAIPVLFHKSNYTRRARETPRTAPQALLAVLVAKTKFSRSCRILFSKNT